MSISKVKITFGIIVLNGEPFIRYNLLALYPFAHQIIVVEGACPGAKNISTSDGHSLDTTLDTLRKFKLNEDNENKLIIVTAEDEGKTTGFWLEKDEMSNAYAKRATGNYIWQIDVDEFYRPEDIIIVLNILNNDPSIKTITFRTHTFWGGLHYKVNSKSLKRMLQDVHRIFAWENGYKYKSHRPPTVVNRDGIDLRTIKWLPASDMVEHQIYMYHYAFLFPKQVEEKCNYYFNSTWNGPNKLSTSQWVYESYFNLKRSFRVYYNNRELSWLEKFTSAHPPQVVAMYNDVKIGKFQGISVRRVDDLDKLLSNRIYKIKRIFVKLIIWINTQLYKLKLHLRSILMLTPIWDFIYKMRYNNSKI